MIGKSLRNREFRENITTCMEQHMEQLPHNGYEKVLQGSTLPVPECKANFSFIRLILSSRKPYKSRLYFQCIRRASMDQNFQEIPMQKNLSR
jgi:hypothetical protein